MPGTCCRQCVKLVLRQAAWRRCRDALGKTYLLIGRQVPCVTGPRILAAGADFTARGDPLVANGASARLLCYFLPWGRQSSLGARRLRVQNQILSQQNQILSRPNPYDRSSNAVFRDSVSRARNAGQY